MQQCEKCDEVLFKESRVKKKYYDCCYVKHEHV